MKPSIHSHPRPLVRLAVIVPTLCASLAFAQLPVRSATSPPAAFSPRPSAGPVTAPNGRTAGVPGVGTAALPPAAPSPSGLAPATPFPAGLPSPIPFPAGTPSTIVAAPGTSAALTGPATAIVPGSAATTIVPGAAVVAPGIGAGMTVVPAPAGVAGTVVTVPGSTRGVVNVPGATLPAPATTVESGVPAAIADTVPNPNRPVGAGTPGAATVDVTGAVVTPMLPAMGGLAGGLTGGTPSVAPQATVAVRGPLTALQVAQFFLQADGDADGLLSRAEALRLPLVTMTFEDMDRNRDGVVSRSEYSDSLQ